MSDVLERFLRYVRIDTASREERSDRVPSTEEQVELARLLGEELRGTAQRLVRAWNADTAVGRQGDGFRAVAGDLLGYGNDRGLICRREAGPCQSERKGRQKEFFHRLFLLV